jgi:hypothetical protein
LKGGADMEVFSFIALIILIIIVRGISVRLSELSERLISIDLTLGRFIAGNEKPPEEIESLN